MLVSEAMTRGVKTIRPDSSLKEAAESMNKYRIGCLVVVSGSGEVQGILTERDMIEAIEKNLIPSKAKVEEFMTKKDDLILIEQDAIIDEAADAMLKYQVKKLPVVDKEGNLVGIITATDIIAKREVLPSKIEALLGMKRHGPAAFAG